MSAPTLSISTNGPSTGSGNGGTSYFNSTKATLSGQTVSITNNGSSTGTGNAGSQTQFYSSGPIQLPTQTFTMTANGSSGGSGNGGPIYFGGTATTIPGSLKSTLTANAGGAGTGNGGTVTLSPTSSVTLGNNAGEFALSATGGSTGGNGGTITVQPFSGNITVDDTATPISVSVPGTTGNGGTITLESTNLTFNGTASQLTANGGTTSGNGGTISLSASGSALTIGTGSAGNVQLYAKAPGNGNGGTINVTDYAGITVNSADLSVLAGTTGNGNGGTITLTGGPATLSGSFNANGSGNGNGGTINFQDGYFTFNGTQSFTANSLGTGKGGNITLNSTYSGQTSTLTLGANTTLQANSTSGNGGTINITAASQPIALTGAGVTVTAGGNGTGGTISVTASANIMTVTGSLDANGAGTGLAGTINLDQQSTATNMNLNGAMISASGATGGSGSGNKINISSETGISMQGTQLNASASGSGNAFGGSISITSAAQVNLTQPLSIIATGATNGAGGTVVISNPAPFAVNINVNSVIDVSAGTGAGTSIFDGSITLNSILCQQWKTGTAGGNWLQTYWNCANPTNSGSPYNGVVTLVQSAQMANVIGQLGTSNVQVYEFATIGNFNTFYELSETDADADTATYSSPPAAAPYVVTSIFPPNPTSQNIEEVAAHEFAHTLDNNAGASKQSSLPDYTNSVTWDFYTLDFYNQNPATRRNACANAPDGTPGPFAGATSENPNLAGAICPSGALAAQFFTNGTAWSNSKIALNTSALFTPNSELYAQAFAENVYVSTLKATPAEMYNETIDIVFVENGQFACASAWAANRATGSNGEPQNHPAYCFTTPPAGYVPGQ